jgi:rubrerythrin
MVDPVNLNVPGLPYLLFALVFFAVVAALSGVLSPIELAIRRHRRSDGEDGERKEDENEDESESGDGGGGDGDRSGSRATDDATVPGTDRLFGTDRGTDADSRAATTIYECRRCGTTLDAGDGQCPRCETASIARYEVG